MSVIAGDFSNISRSSFGSMYLAIVTFASCGNWLIASLIWSFAATRHSYFSIGISDRSTRKNGKIANSHEYASADAHVHRLSSLISNQTFLQNGTNPIPRIAAGRSRRRAILEMCYGCGGKKATVQKDEGGRMKDEKDGTSI